MMNTQKKEYQPHVGLWKVFPPDGKDDNSTVDIIAIHGLDTDSPRTWTYKSGANEINWLEDARLLPAAVPQARIYTYNWDAKVFADAPIETIFGHAEKLMALLQANQSTPSRPILFIASCFGGLILTEAITRAAKEGSQYRKILESTVGIVFLATPFFGTDAASQASLLAVVQEIMGKDASRLLIKNLEKGDNEIQDRTHQFGLIVNYRFKMPVSCFYETKPTKIIKKVLGKLVPNQFLRGSILVTKKSACLDGHPQWGLGRNHVMMNKFEKQGCPDYILVKQAILSILNDAPATLKSRLQPSAQPPIEPELNEEQRARLLASLKFKGLNELKNREKKRTFQWVFDATDSASGDDPFALDGDTRHISPEASGGPSAKSESQSRHSIRSWLRSKHKTFWISGKLGSGKTTLVKYLIDNPLTTEALSVWAKDPVIVSHFFWKAGSVDLQKNIKGCLCSILYQSLERRPVPFDTILSMNKSVLTKTSETDWSLEELRALCLKILGNYPSPVCMFLDGLDEIRIEDRLDILDLVNELQAIPNTKICLASRPEPHLQSAFSNYPQLRLQDLTFRDMENFVSKAIQPFVSKGRISSYVGKYFMETLIRKAEGVFLWLRLALDDLVRGLQNSDSDKELYVRLEQMPADIYKLYEDIWTRINEESAIYRAAAALYFKLVIASNIVNELSLLHFAVATTNLPQDFSIDTLNADHLDKKCEATKLQIRERCIGLLEIAESPYSTNQGRWGTRAASLLPYSRTMVRFPHRSVYDFFTETDEGDRILNFDSSTSHDLSLRLLRADLATTKFIRRGYVFNKARFDLRTLSDLADVFSAEEINEFLDGIRYLYNRGYYGTSMIKPHFLLLAAVLRFRQFVLSEIESSPDPALLATDVLRFKSNSLPACGDYLTELSDFSEPLMKLKANPSSKGICYGSDFYNEIVPEIRFRSATAGFLYEIIRYNMDDSGGIDKRLKQLRRFIEAGPNLQERVPLRINIMDTDEGVEIQGDFDDMNLYPNSSNVVVLDVDLGFLVGAYFKRALKKGMISSESIASYQPPIDELSDYSIHIALLGFEGHFNPLSADHSSADHSSADHSSADYSSADYSSVDGSLSDRLSLYRWGMNDYQCPSGTATRQLLELLVQFLYGDESRDIAQKVRDELERIKDEIRSHQSGYRRVTEKRITTFLANRNLGWCFVNEAGVVVNSLDEAEAHT
ncbi:hypothetical protein F5Y14DRAFT_428311 [Nemania sp. NC0429]|nr:hypothetical protein F5Y14DRAFT_428311 [Nemania sp. NC0429]